MVLTLNRHIPIPFDPIQIYSLLTRSDGLNWMWRVHKRIWQKRCTPNINPYYRLTRVVCIYMPSNKTREKSLNNRNLILRALSARPTLRFNNTYKVGLRRYPRSIVNLADSHALVKGIFFFEITDLGKREIQCHLYPFQMEPTVLKLNNSIWN